MKKRWPKQKTARQIKNRVILDMWYMTEKKYNEKMLDLQIRNRQIEIRQNLKAEKNKYQKPFKLPSTSKLMLLTVILLCLEVIVFCEYIILQRGDMRAMYALLVLPVTLSLAIWAITRRPRQKIPLVVLCMRRQCRRGSGLPTKRGDFPNKGAPEAG